MNRNQLLALIGPEFDRSKSIRAMKDAGKRSLFEENEEAEADWPLPPGFDLIPDRTLKEKMADELEVFGFYLTCNPLGIFADKLSVGTISIYEVTESQEGSKVTVGGVIYGIRKFSTKKSDREGLSECCSFVLKDNSGEIACVMWASEFQKFSKIAPSCAAAIVSGKFGLRLGVPQIIVNDFAEVA